MRTLIALGLAGALWWAAGWLVATLDIEAAPLLLQAGLTMAALGALARWLDQAEHAADP